jgi:hypothetical protein
MDGILPCQSLSKLKSTMHDDVMIPRKLDLKDPRPDRGHHQATSADFSRVDWLLDKEL